jgi:hypothetical protein
MILLYFSGFYFRPCLNYDYFYDKIIINCSLKKRTIIFKVTAIPRMIELAEAWETGEGAKQLADGVQCWSGPAINNQDFNRGNGLLRLLL